MDPFAEQQRGADLVLCARWRCMLFVKFCFVCVREIFPLSNNLLYVCFFPESVVHKIAGHAHKDNLFFLVGVGGWGGVSSQYFMFVFIQIPKQDKNA